MRTTEQALTGKAVVVTGAGQGLGRAYAIEAAKSGASVLVNDIQADLADSVSAEIVGAGGSAIADHHSVATWDGAESIVSACIRHFSRIDGLVNNAGILRIAEPWLQTEKDIRATVDVNLVGAIYCGVHAIGAMVRQSSGAIVDVTSGAQMGRALMSTYGATRAGTAALTYGWAIDCSPHNIRVNAIWPGAATQISVAYLQTGAARARRNLPSVPPEVNAPLVTFLLSDLSEGITGQVVALRGRSMGIMSHPALTEHVVERDDYWDLDSIVHAFKTSLKQGFQPVGAPT